MRHNLKVTLIQPDYFNVWEPLGLGYIASYCRKFRPDVEFKFWNEKFDDALKFDKHILQSDIIGISATTPTSQRAINLARKIKTYYNKRVVLGGWHVTALKDIPDWSIDQIVVGEGEAGFLNILNGDTTDIVKGKLMEFNELPWPDRKLIRNERTLTLCEEMCGERILSFQSRRGCPMKCAMCGEKNMSHNCIRSRDVVELLDEIVQMSKEYNATKFKFVDPTWCYPKSYVYTFCKEKIRQNFTLKWEAMVHAAFLDEDMMTLMKEANCEQVNVGCESGSQSILNDIGKGVTITKVKRVFQIGKRLGINMRAFFMIGMPNESCETITETKEFIRELQPDVLGVSIFTPYPGTEFYNDSYSHIDWYNCDEYNNDFWDTKYITNEELKKIQKDIMTEFEDKSCWHNKVNDEKTNS